MFTTMLSMIRVTRRSRGEVSKWATSCLRLSGSFLNALTFMEDRENRATSEEEKNPEQKRKRNKKMICTAITCGLVNSDKGCRFENKLSFALQARARAPFLK